MRQPGGEPVQATVTVERVRQQVPGGGRGK